jgi:hypothetical protein
MLGSDFSLMTSLFNDRDRSSLKYKFDHEHELNPAKLDDAMYTFRPLQVFRIIWYLFFKYERIKL